MRTSTTSGKHSPSKTVLKTARVLLVAVFWLAVWQGICMWLDNALLMVSPLAVGKRLIELSGTAEFWAAIGVSFGRVFLGYLLGTLAGVVLGTAGGFSGAVHTLVPAAGCGQSGPVTSFVILALVWIKSYNLSIFVAFLVVFPPVYMSVYNGIKGVDRNLLEVAQVYRFSKQKTFRLCYLPAILPLFGQPYPPRLALHGRPALPGRFWPCRDRYRHHAPGCESLSGNLRCLLLDSCYHLSKRTGGKTGPTAG